MEANQTNTVTLSNKIHNTTVTLRVVGDTLSASQVKRARRALCGIADCRCGTWRGQVVVMQDGRGMLADPDTLTGEGRC